MSRIRSIHPGFFTDERLVSTSVTARLLFIGIGVEADDKGVFEWKPITLKMRLFPADNVDIAMLLEELISAGVITAYEIDGRKYGAIRNFRRHQRPKTPNDIHPIPDNLRKYVGLSDDVSETPPNDPDAFPPKGEMPSQMEDGGGGEEKDGQKPIGFSGRASAQKKSGSSRGWVSRRTVVDATASLIEEIEDHEHRRAEGSNEIAGNAIRLLSAVRTG